MSGDQAVQKGDSEIVSLRLSVCFLVLGKIIQKIQPLAVSFLRTCL